MISGRAGSTILLFRQARSAGLTVVTVRRVTGLSQQRENVSLELHTKVETANTVLFSDTIVFVME